MNELIKPLKARQERFAQRVAQGIPLGRAYEESGYKSRGHAAYVNGAALFQQSDVKARVAEIQELAAGLGTTLLTIQEKRSFLAELVRTPVGSIGPDSRLCQEFYERVKVQGKPKDGKTEAEGGELLLRRRIRMGDKLRAIELDSKLAGHFPKAGTEPEKVAQRPPTVDPERIREVVTLMWQGRQG
jgi:hypothetical protein